MRKAKLFEDKAKLEDVVNLDNQIQTLKRRLDEIENIYFEIPYGLGQKKARYMPISKVIHNICRHLKLTFVSGHTTPDKLEVDEDEVA